MSGNEFADKYPDIPSEAELKKMLDWQLIELHRTINNDRKCELDLYTLYSASYKGFTLEEDASVSEKIKVKKNLDELKTRIDYLERNCL